MHKVKEKKTAVSWGVEPLRRPFYRLDLDCLKISQTWWELRGLISEYRTKSASC